MRRAPLAVLIVAAAALAGCGPKMIPNSEIRDTEENRQVLSIVAAYRSALESRNVERIMNLVSKSFFETSGTPEDGNDYNYEGLEQHLTEWAAKTKALRADVKVKTIDLKDGTATVRYFYDINYQIPGPADTLQWKHEADTKEMHLRREGDVWRITSGI